MVFEYDNNKVLGKNSRERVSNNVISGKYSQASFTFSFLINYFKNGSRQIKQKSIGHEAKFCFTTSNYMGSHMCNLLLCLRVPFIW